MTRVVFHDNPLPQVRLARLEKTPHGRCVQEFLEFVIRQLVDYPDEMVLTKEETPKKVTFSLQLRQSDVGKVIGKHGNTISAIRDLLNAAASRHGQRAFLEIVEEETERAA